jgi:hypothetical protein
VRERWRLAFTRVRTQVDLVSVNSTPITIGVRLTRGPAPTLVNLLPQTDGAAVLWSYPTFSATATGHANAAGAMVVGAVPVSVHARHPRVCCAFSCAFVW